MNTPFRTLLGVAAATLSILAYAADAPASAPPMKGDSYSTKAKTMGKEKADVKAQENMRMGACKSMTGDEKKNCMTDAKTKAAAEMKRDKAHDNAMGASSVPNK